MKQLKASSETKRFSKLAIDYIGHSTFNYDDQTLEELDGHLKKLTEMHDLMKKLNIEISKKTK